MNNYVLLSISMAACLMNNVVKKTFVSKTEGNEAPTFAFNAAVSLVCALCLFIIGGVPKISLFTLLLGILFGAVTATQQIFQMKAYKTGPFSYTSVIISLSTMIPALSGYFIWNESIEAIQIVGMVLMLACFALSVDFKASDKRASAAWLIFVFIAFFTTGLIGVMQKWHQSTEFSSELDGFLITAFLFSFVFSSAATAVCGFRARARGDEFMPKNMLRAVALLFVLICGICTAANNKLNLFLSGVMDSAVFFPIVNGGGMILSAIASLIIFKEKIGRQKLIGLGIGVVAVVLICNPF